MKEIQLQDLLQAGCHFGHQTTRLHPKTRSFIFTKRDKVHIIDLAKTKEGLERAGEFVKNPVNNHSLYLFKENVNIPINKGARVRFRVVSYADGTTVSTNIMKDIKPENMTFVVVYKEALISG